MERLTTRDANCADPKVLYGVWVEDHDYISAANRLADYEDTGLAPEEIEKLRGQVPRWIPVEERLPENFRKVLCWGEYFRYGDFNGMFVNYALGYQNNGSWGGEVANGANARALAWMPLPEPPEVE